jgi:methylase of polypeptide subunit release factors
LVIDQPALVELLHYLSDAGYRFVAVTPATHARVLDRPFDGKPSLRDIFGWNRPFSESDIDETLLALLQEARAVKNDCAGKLRSAIRVAGLADRLFVHSGYPTDQADAVFFGPDTYRFWRFVQGEFGDGARPEHVVDMGAGSGVGGILASRLLGEVRTTLVDVNEKALTFARANAAAVGVKVECVQSDEIPDGADLVIANPPYLMDEASRTYRDGGGALLGGAISCAWAEQALQRMRAGGVMLMYTGAAFADGSAPLLDAVTALCRDLGAAIRIDEIDPDVFGEELACPSYSQVERIAAVGVRIEKAGGG